MSAKYHVSLSKINWNLYSPSQFFNPLKPSKQVEKRWCFWRLQGQQFIGAFSPLASIFFYWCVDFCSQVDIGLKWTHCVVVVAAIFMIQVQNHLQPWLYIEYILTIFNAMSSVSKIKTNFRNKNFKHTQGVAFTANKALPGKTLYEGGVFLVPGLLDVSWMWAGISTTFL